MDDLTTGKHLGGMKASQRDIHKSDLQFSSRIYEGNSNNKKKTAVYLFDEGGTQSQILTLFL